MTHSAKYNIKRQFDLVVQFEILIEKFGSTYIGDLDFNV